MPKLELSHQSDPTHIPDIVSSPPMELKPKRVLIGIGTGCVVLIIGLSVSYLITNYINPTATPVPPIVINKATSTPNTATPSAQKSETADWIAYTSEKYGFKVKYPSDWSVREEEYPDPNDLKGGVDYAITVFEKYDNKISVSWRPLGRGLEGYDIVKVLIDGVSTQKSTLSESNLIKEVIIGQFGYKGDRTGIGYSKTNKQDWYGLEFISNSSFKNNEEYVQIFNDLVSTFKFLD